MIKKISLLTIMLSSLIFLMGCTKGERPAPSNNTNYNNVNTPTTGSVSITASWSNPAPWNACGAPYTVIIGLGYNSTDISTEAYFAQNSFINSPASFSKESLTAGIYYYKAKKTFNASICGTGQDIPPTVTKSGSFIITAGQTTTVNGVSLN